MKMTKTLTMFEAKLGIICYYHTIQPIFWKPNRGN